jgi:tRNA threonylcarbamoyladenosine biosynthesis protein TsaB
VGLVCGKTMAYATGAKLVAVDSFQAVARNAPPDVTRLFVIGDAQRGDLFVGEYQRSPEGRWERDGHLQIADFDAWNAGLQADAIVSGPGLETYRDHLDRPEQALDPESWRPRAAHVAHIGAEDAAAGVAHDPFSIDPIYGRKSSAEEKLESRSQ